MNTKPAYRDPDSIEYEEIKSAYRDPDAEAYEAVYKMLGPGPIAYRDPDAIEKDMMAFAYDFNALTEDINGFINRTNSERTDRHGQYQDGTMFKGYADNKSREIYALESRLNQAKEYLSKNRKNIDTFYGLGTTDNALEYFTDSLELLSDIRTNLYAEAEFWNLFNEDEYQEKLKSIPEIERLSELDIDQLIQQRAQYEAFLRSKEKELDFVLKQTYTPYILNPDGTSTGMLPADQAKANAAEEAELFSLKKQIEQIKATINRLDREIDAATQIQSTIFYNLNKEKPDFDIMVAIGRAMENPDFLRSEESLFGKEKVINKVKFAEDNIKKFALGSEGYRNPYLLVTLFATEDEKQIYHYILATQGSEEADKYFNFLADVASRRYGKSIAESVLGHPLRELGYAFAAGVEQFNTGLKQRFSNDVLMTSPFTYASNEIYDKIDWGKGEIAGRDIGQFFYQGVSSIGNMTPAMLIYLGLGAAGAPTAIGNLASAAALGISASGNAYGEALKQGYTKKEANNYSILVGASEAGLQYLLGGISAFGGKVTGNVIKNAVTKIDNVLLRAVTKLGIELAGEGVEEYLQEIITPALRNICFDEYNQIKLFSQDALYAGLMGMLTAGLLEGPTTISNTVKAYDYGQMISEAGKLNELLDNAMKLAPKTEAFKLAESINKGKIKASFGNIGDLLLAYKADGGDISFLYPKKDGAQTANASPNGSNSGDDTVSPLTNLPQTWSLINDSASPQFDAAKQQIINNLEYSPNYEALTGYVLQQIETQAARDGTDLDAILQIISNRYGPFYKLN